MVGRTITSVPPQRDEGEVPTLLIKKWDGVGGEAYYGRLRLGGISYSCGDCVAMETDRGE